MMIIDELKIMFRLLLYTFVMFFLLLGYWFYKTFLTLWINLNPKASDCIEDYKILRFFEDNMIKISIYNHDLLYYFVGFYSKFVKR